MNEKTKNSGRMILRIVAILLCLVLITTSIVSSTLAKFIVTKDATTVVSLKKFGIALNMNKGSHYDQATATPKIADDGSTISVTLSNIKLLPGANYSEIVYFTITLAAAQPGSTPKASVKTRVKVRAVVNASTSENLDKFKYNETVYIPISAKMRAGVGKTTYTEHTIAAAWSALSFDDYQTNITTGLKTALGTVDDTWAGQQVADKGGTYIRGDAVSYISFGFEVPYEYGTGTEVATYDKILTNIAQNNPTISITYYISLEQM